jgi:4-hydroxyproline epimerase
MQRIHVIDSHTAGEPTRVVVSGGPALGSGSVADRRTVFREKFDRFRSAVVNEPRGSDVLVGALLVEPSDPDCAAGVIFFNNVGYLGMCGHGTIGLMVTLAHLGRISTGVTRLETPAGIVAAELHADGSVSVENVPSYRYKKDVPVHVPSIGTIHGDIVWGGNWFFIVEDHGQSLDLKNVEALTAYAWAVRLALAAQGMVGADGGEIDHIELGVRNKNFMLCPGKAYDRSPCGTGTSAKLACLAADGKLKPGEIWTQAGILDTTFAAHYRLGARPGEIVATITGTAFVTGSAELLLDERDPFCWGIR